MSLDTTSIQQWSDVLSKMDKRTYFQLLTEWNKYLQDGVLKCIKAPQTLNYWKWGFEFECVMFITSVLKKYVPQEYNEFHVKPIMEGNFFKISYLEYIKWKSDFIKGYQQRTDTFEKWWIQQTRTKVKQIHPFITTMVKLCLERIPKNDTSNPNHKARKQKQQSGPK